MLSKEATVVRYNAIVDHFFDLPDPRVDRTKKHPLVDILFIALCAVISGADGFVEIADFGRARIDWFRQYLELPNGIPVHDTFARVFARLDPAAFSQCFVNWMRALQEETDGRVVAIDGKTLRRSFDKATGNAAIHMVSAFASQNSLVLGQVKVNEKSNEITAIPDLLTLLDLENAIVTIDAMGTQKNIAYQIVTAGADYILALKDNHPNLNADVRAVFERAMAESWRDAQDQGIPHTRFQTRDHDHGRIETRTCWAMECPDWVQDYQEWKGLRSIVLIQSHRSTKQGETQDQRFYISSLPPEAKLIGKAGREHWAIENNLHWVLDVIFREDECRIRKDNAPQNVAVTRHIALNLIKEEKTKGMSVNRKRHMAAWDTKMLEQIVFGNHKNI